MSSKYQDFFDIPTEDTKSAQPSATSDQSFFDIPSNPEGWGKPEAPPVSEQLKTAPGLFAREGASNLYSLPSNAAEGYRFIAKKLQGYGEDLAAKEGREITDEERALTDKFVNYVPDLVKSLGEEYPKLFPTKQQAKEKIGARIEKNTGIKLPEKARGAIERGAEGAAKAADVLAFPGSALVKGTAIATSAATEALDLSEGGKLGTNLTVPTLTALLEAILKKKYIPSGADAERLMEAGERFGMTNRELAPILATESQVGRHGRSAATVRGTREGFERTGNVLGGIVHGVQSQPAAAVQVGRQAEGRLINQLTDIATDMRGRTHALAPHQQQLVDFIDTAVRDIQQNGSSPRQLIGTWRSVNRIGAGRTELRRILDPIYEAIESVNPQIARDLRDSNAMYSQYMRNLQEIRPTQFNHFMDAGELQSFLGSVFTKDPVSFGHAARRFITVKAWEKLSSTILTNPNMQSLVRNFGRAVRDGGQASARALGVQLKNYVKKNLPEEYKDIKWEELGIED